MQVKSLGATTVLAVVLTACGGGRTTTPNPVNYNAASTNLDYYSTLFFIEMHDRDWAYQHLIPTGNILIALNRLGFVSRKIGQDLFYETELQFGDPGEE